MVDLLNRLPLDLSGLESHSSTMGSTLLRYAMYGLVVQLPRFTYANMVKVEAFDSEEERQAAYEQVFGAEPDVLTHEKLAMFLDDLKSGRVG